MSLSADLRAAPGQVRRRVDVPTRTAYSVFDCETTGTTPGVDEIVSLALVRLDAQGIETARFTRLVRPSCPIPADATAVHGIDDGDVASAPRFYEIAPELRGLLDDAVFVAHNASFDLDMLQHAFARIGLAYAPTGVACTLDAFRLLEPLADNHRLESICERHDIVLEDAHDALSDVLATTALLRVLLDEGYAPETVELDHEAFLRLRSRGDTRLASPAQIRRVFALGYAAGLNRDGIVVAVARATGATDVDSLTREQVQVVYDALDRLSPARRVGRAA